MKYSKITQRGDTIHLNIPKELLSNFQFDRSCFNTKMNMDDSGVVLNETLLLKDTYKGFGLNELSILDKHIEVKVSGKILETDYREGITLNTISTVVDKLNQSCDMNISVDDILTKSVMRTFDNTYNIPLDEKDCVGEYVNALSFGAIGNSKLGLTQYGDESIELKLDTKVKNRLLFYNKEVELQTKSKEFYKVFGKNLDFRDTLRVELNVNRLDKMRQNWALNQSKPTLGDILNSKVNAIERNFARFVDKRTSLKYLFDYDTMIQMEAKTKIENLEIFFLKEKFKFYKGDVKRVLKLYSNWYKNGRVPARESKKIKSYFKIWSNQSSKLSVGVKENYTKKFRELDEKIRCLN